MDVSKNRVSPKMDGKDNGKPYEQMDDLGGFTHIFGNIHMLLRKTTLKALLKWLTTTLGIDPLDLQEWDEYRYVAILIYCNPYAYCIIIYIYTY